jgi:hypothetical protein
VVKLELERLRDRILPGIAAPAVSRTLGCRERSTFFG